jgi:protein TonB
MLALNQNKKNKISPAISLKELGTISLSASNEKEVEEVFKELEKHEKAGKENGTKNGFGVAANNDFIEDIPLGDVTNLNTTENKYYGFYHRIRQKLEQYWGSTIHAQARKLYKAGRRMPASDNLITAVVVVLSDKGQIIDIKIEGTSGIRELDQAAVESFNKAGPFPNPPKGLLIGGRAIISWGFVVKS